MAFDPEHFATKIDNEFDPTQFGAIPHEEDTNSLLSKTLKESPHALTSFASGFVDPLAQSLQNIGKGADFLRQFAQGVPYKEINTSGVEFLPKGKSLSDIDMPNKNNEASELGQVASSFLIPGSKIAKGSSYLLSAAKRAAPLVGYEALINKNPLEGLEKGLLGAAGLEGLGIVGKGIPKAISKTAEVLNPQNFTNDIFKNIFDRYHQAKNTASHLYEGVKNKFGNKSIYENKDIRQGEFKNTLSGIQEDYKLPSTIKDELRKFQDDPSLTNAHNLQSKIGEEIGELQRSYPRTQDDRYGIANLSKLRKSLNNDIFHNLSFLDKNALSDWREATKIYREEVAPYRSNKDLHLIAEGNKSTITPKRLKDSIQKVSEFTGKNEKIPQNHYLREALQQLKGKYNRGKLIEGASALGTGFALGGPMGALAAKLVSPYVTKIAQNPYLVEKLTKIGRATDHPLAKMGRNAIITNILNQPNS